MTASNAVLTLRPSDERGHADHDWLKTYHTFSFASYYGPDHESWGPLRVINEDRVEPTKGFGTHGHREFEIFSVILSGELEHRDSLGGLETMKRGDVQLTSTGTGVRHSEYNRHPAKGVHFLQIWSQPSTSGLTPKYYHRHYPDEQKRDVLLPIVAPVGSKGVTDEREGSGPTPIHADMVVYTSLLSPAKSVSRPVAANAKRGFVHLATSAYRAPGQSPPADAAQVVVSLGTQDKTLKEGDGLYITFSGVADEISFKNEGKQDGELVYFDMTA